MSEKDFAISVTSAPNMGTISRKPSYLVTLEDASGKGKTKGIARFITLDKPDFHDSFIQVKGVYSDLSEDDIVSDFVDILSKTKKEEFLDMMFPVQKVCSIRSLVFNANKPSTLVGK
jgi:hypothetical protein